MIFTLSIGTLVGGAGFYVLTGLHSLFSSVVQAVFTRPCLALGRYIGNIFGCSCDSGDTGAEEDEDMINQEEADALSETASYSGSRDGSPRSSESKPDLKAGLFGDLPADIVAGEPGSRDEDQLCEESKTSIRNSYKQTELRTQSRYLDSTSPERAIFSRMSGLQEQRKLKQD